MKQSKKKRWRTLGLTLTGLILLGSGLFVAIWQDAQTLLYNQGLQLYILAQTAGSGDSNNPIKTPQERTKALVDATKMFALSIEVYQSETKMGWVPRFIFPHPDRHLAAKASFRTGNCLNWLKQEKDAVAAYEYYLQLNPGGENDRFQADTFSDQHNLEVLFNHNPELQKQEGKGKGKGSGSGDKKQQGPAGNQAGHAPHTKM